VKPVLSSGSPPHPASSPLADPLAGLRDIHLPEPVSWWPPAPGWWLLALLVLLISAAVIGWLRWRKAQQAKAKVFSQHEMIDQALLEIDRLQQLTSSGADVHRTVTELSGLLRRVAMRLDVSQGGQGEQTDIAGLSGESWLAWLDGQWDSNTFSQDAGRQLLDAPFQRDGEVDIAALLEISRAWVEAQR